MQRWTAYRSYAWHAKKSTHTETHERTNHVRFEERMILKSNRKLLIIIN